MPGTVADVPHIEWDVVGNDAEMVIKEKMDFFQDKAEETLLNLYTAIDDLKKIITSASMPSYSINYDHISENIEADLDGLRPEKPNFPTTSGIDKPERKELIDVDIPTFPTIDGFDEDAPTDTFEWHETINDYQSDLLDAVKASLLNWIQNGGTGLAEDVEEAIFERARTRLREEWEDAYDNADNGYASKKMFIPSGAKISTLNNINKMFERKLEDLNQKILEVQANLAQNNTQFAHTLSVKLEGQLQDFFNKVTERLFTAAKETVSLLYEIFTQKVNAYVAKTDGKKAEITAKAEIVNAQVSVNKGINDYNIADSQRYKSEIDAVIGVIDGMAKVYASEINGYEADISVEKANLTAKVEKLRAMVSQATDQTSLQIKDAEVSLQAYINSLGLNIEVAKTIASILSQIAASTLRGMQTNVTMSDQSSRNYSGQYSHHENLGNSYTHHHSDS